MGEEERKLRVGLLIDRWDEDRGGAERALFQLARHLGARGHRVLAFAAEGAPGVSRADAAELVRVPAPPALFGLVRGTRERRLGRALLAAAEEAGCDVTVGVRHLERVDVLWPHGGAHAVAWNALRSARAGRALPAIAPARWSRHRAFLELEAEALAGGARHVVCVSELVRRELAELHPSARARLVTIPNGVDLARFHPRERGASGRALRRELGLAADVPLIACAARNPVLKGVLQLLEALARLTERRWSCLVAGPRAARAWERRARAHGLSAERVRFVAETDPVALASACDLAVLPTWRDTSGLFVLEALASGTPVITTARAGAAEALSDPRAGTVLAEPGDAGALVGALGAWLERIERGTVDRDAVRASVADLALDTTLARFEALLLALAQEKRACATRG